MSASIEEWREKHGREWAKYAQSECFKDLQATIEGTTPFLQVLGLPPAELNANGAVIVARQVGFLTYANALREAYKEPTELIPDGNDPNAYLTRPEDEVDLEPEPKPRKQRSRK